MRIAPGASPKDGKLWVTIVEPKSKLRMLFKELPKVASGDHVNSEGFHYFSTSRIEITSDVPVVMDPDGEAEWGTQATLNVVPGDVRFLAPD